MSSRQEQLSDLRNYIKEIDKEVTMILQSLQWDRKHLLQCPPKRTCKYDTNHAVPPEKLKEHEDKCVLKSQGYAEGDTFLPDVFDANANTVLKLTTENITDIINYASKTDPEFKRGEGNVASEPLTFERLQACYSADERRALYDVVVTSRPACDDLADLAMTGEAGGSSQAQSKRKSKLALLAELRNMRRRRTKYRVAVRSRNYSDTLRGVIEAQMEMFNEAQGHSNSISQKQSDKNSNVKVEPLDHTSVNNTVEHRDVTKERRNAQYSERRNTYDTDRRSKYDSDGRNYSYSKRNHDNDYSKNSRCFDRDRRQFSAEERNKCDDNVRSRPERNKAYGEEKEPRNKVKERNRTYVKDESDKYSSSSKDSSRYRESEREERYYKYKNSHDDRHRRERSEHKRYNDDQSNIKREYREDTKEKRKYRPY